LRRQIFTKKNWVGVSGGFAKVMNENIRTAENIVDEIIKAKNTFGGVPEKLKFIEACQRRINAEESLETKSSICDEMCGVLMEAWQNNPLLPEPLHIRGYAALLQLIQEWADGVAVESKVTKDEVLAIADDIIDEMLSQADAKELMEDAFLTLLEANRAHE